MNLHMFKVFIVLFIFATIHGSCAKNIEVITELATSVEDKLSKSTTSSELPVTVYYRMRGSIPYATLINIYNETEKDEDEE